MSVILQGVLEAEDVARIRDGLADAPWRAGKHTAGRAARAGKENEQADGAAAAVQSLERFVTDALQRHALFDIAARPAKISRVLFSRYAPGMTYASHTDDALMGAEGARLRSDLAFTLFLSERGEYDGGALVVESMLGEEEITLDAGDAILYPAGSIHRVAPVTRGVRLAAVGWVQSLIADGARRELLFDLSVARTRLAAGGAAAAELLRLDKSIANLLRMWARF